MVNMVYMVRMSINKPVGVMTKKIHIIDTVSKVSLTCF